jgi:acyl transferase domain-containing protein
MAVCFPGALREPEAFYAVGSYGIDGFTQFPLGRWDLDAYFDPFGEDTGKAYAIHGAFIEGADLFDNLGFRISPAEANEMDPHQRKLLQVGYDALIAGGDQTG